MQQLEDMNLIKYVGISTVILFSDILGLVKLQPLFQDHKIKWLKSK